MDTKALNEKLLKFVEYKRERIQGTFISYTPPDLVNSLDAQAKWIYPKLITNNFRITKDFSPREKICHIEIYTANNEGVAENESESLAVALAVEKLIDSMDINHDD